MGMTTIVIRRHLVFNRLTVKCSGGPGGERGTNALDAGLGGGDGASPHLPLPLIWSAKSAAEATCQTDPAWLPRASPQLQEGAGGPSQYTWLHWEVATKPLARVVRRTPWCAPWY